MAEFIFKGFVKQGDEKSKDGMVFSCAFDGTKEFVETITEKLGIDRTAALLANGFRDTLLKHGKVVVREDGVKALKEALEKVCEDVTVELGVKPEPKTTVDVFAKVEKMSDAEKAKLLALLTGGGKKESQE